LVPAVWIIGNCLKVLSRNSWKYVLDNFYRFILCVYVCVDYCTENIRVVSVQISEEATKNDKSFGPEKYFVR